MAPRGGICEGCGQETGGLTVHQRSCRNTKAIIERAGAHAYAWKDLRAAQRLQHGVTELDVARVMCGLEQGARLYLSRTNRWCAGRGSALHSLERLSPTVHEMIRTGLVRHWRDREGDHLVPARVHFMGPDRKSACHFAGEDLGPMRARLSQDMAVVDCLECEAIQTGVNLGRVRPRAL